MGNIEVYLMGFLKSQTVLMDLNFYNEQIKLKYCFLSKFVIAINFYEN